MPFEIDETDILGSSSGGGGISKGKKDTIKNMFYYIGLGFYLLLKGIWNFLVQWFSVLKLLFIEIKKIRKEFF